MPTRPLIDMFRPMVVDALVVSEVLIRSIPLRMPVSVFALRQLAATITGAPGWRIAVAKRLCQRWRGAGLVAAGPKGVWFWIDDAHERLLLEACAAPPS